MRISAFFLHFPLQNNSSAHASYLPSGKFLPPGRLGTHILVKIGLHHSIINFSVLIRFPADVPFRILISGNQIHGPGIQRRIPLPQSLYRGREALTFLKALAVRRVGNEGKPYFFGWLSWDNGRRWKWIKLVHSSQLGVFLAMETMASSIS